MVLQTCPSTIASSGQKLSVPKSTATSFGLPQATRVSIGAKEQNEKFASALSKIL